ncbi:MAG: hypothetical protein QXD08_06240, partial [Pyrobaculum sp.]
KSTEHYSYLKASTMFNLLALYAGANTPKRFGTMINNADVAKIGSDISSPRTRPGPSGFNHPSE